MGERTWKVKLTLHNTNQVVFIDGIEARIWEGNTDKGVPVSCLIARIAVDNDDDHTEFDRDLRETPAPKPTIHAWSNRMLL